MAPAQELQEAVTEYRVTQAELAEALTRVNWMTKSVTPEEAMTGRVSLTLNADDIAWQIVSQLRVAFAFRDPNEQDVDGPARDMSAEHV